MSDHHQTTLPSGDILRYRKIRGAEDGFTLLELLVVIAVILILLAFEVPNLFRARALADQAAAEASVRAIQTAEITYSEEYPNGFSPDLKSLAPAAGAPASSSAAGLIDEVLASGNKNGYTYIYIPGAPEDGKIGDYTVVAVPNTPCISGLGSYTASPYGSPTPTASPGATTSGIGMGSGGSASCGGG